MNFKEISPELHSSDEERMQQQEQPLHKKARQERPPMYPERFPVPDDKVDWDVEYQEYKPSYFVAQAVLENDVTKKTNGWADPEDLNEYHLNKKKGAKVSSGVKDLTIDIAHREYQESKKAFRSYEGEVRLDTNGKPLNPRGRTGIEGRGLLGKWAANFAADPIVTRVNPETNQVEMLAIQRKDTKEWAIPGGMVDEGEAVSQTLKREFQEEAGVELDMDDAVEVYKGYVDDPRNTDNAWMETTAMHKHLTPELATKMNPEAGDDAQDVTWFPLSQESLNRLYASHGEVLKKAMSKFYEDESGNLPQEAQQQIETIVTNIDWQGE